MRFPGLHPIFRREVLGYLRSPWMRWGALVCLLVPFAAIALAWPRDQLYFGGARQSAQVVKRYFICMLILASIIFPTMGAFAIATERKNRTYDALFMTAMPSWTIGIAKLSAILVAGMLLMAASLPALSITFVLGGVDGNELLELATLALICPLICGGIGLVFSIVCKKGHAALIASYIATLPLLVMTWILLAERLRFFQLTQAVRGRLFGTPPPLMHWGIMVFLLAITVIVVCYLIGLTRHPPEEWRQSEVRPIDDPSRLWSRRNQWPYYIVDPARRPAPVADRANPLILKEQLNNPLFRSAWRWRGFAIAIAMVLVGSVAAIPYPAGGTRGPDEILRIIWLGSMGCAAVWATLTAAVAFTAEHEAQTIETLKLTRLEAMDFVRSKWLVCWKLRWPYTALMLALLGLMLLLGGQTRFCGMWLPDHAVLAATLSVGIIEVSAITATWVAAHTRSASQATAWTLGIMMVVLGGTALTLSTLWVWVYGSHYGSWSRFTYGAYWSAANDPRLYGYAWNYSHWLFFALSAWGVFCVVRLLRQYRRLWKSEE